ncbi:MAG: flagellar protein FlaG [FCB group bacterium]|nr:flagellar protein FlaG [FCB group bacterium]
METINPITTNFVPPVSKTVASVLQQEPIGRVEKTITVEKQQTDVQNEKTNKEEVDFAKLASKVSTYVESFSTKVSFSIDERTDKPVIRVTDKETGELIRQIPEQEMLDLLSKLEYIAGLIYHKQA